MLKKKVENKNSKVGTIIAYWLNAYKKKKIQLTEWKKNSRHSYFLTVIHWNSISNRSRFLLSPEASKTSSGLVAPLAGTFYSFFFLCYQSYFISLHSALNFVLLKTVSWRCATFLSLVKTVENRTDNTALHWLYL